MKEVSVVLTVAVLHHPIPTRAQIADLRTDRDVASPVQTEEATDTVPIMIEIVLLLATAIEDVTNREEGREMSPRADLDGERSDPSPLNRIREK